MSTLYPPWVCEWFLQHTEAHPTNGNESIESLNLLAHSLFADKNYTECATTCICILSRVISSSTSTPPLLSDPERRCFEGLLGVSLLHSNVDERDGSVQIMEYFLHQAALFSTSEPYFILSSLAYGKFLMQGGRNKDAKCVFGRVFEECKELLSASQERQSREGLIATQFLTMNGSQKEEENLIEECYSLLNDRQRVGLSWIAMCVLSTKLKLVQEYSVECEEESERWDELVHEFLASGDDDDIAIQVHYLIGMGFFQTREYPRAHKEIEKAIEQIGDPNGNYIKRREKAQLHFDLARCLTCLGDNEGASCHYQKVLELDPLRCDARRICTDLHVETVTTIDMHDQSSRMRTIREALDKYAKCFDGDVINPNITPNIDLLLIRYHRGMLLLRIGEILDAKREFERIVMEVARCDATPEGSSLPFLRRRSLTGMAQCEEFLHNFTNSFDLLDQVDKEMESEMRAGHELECNTKGNEFALVVHRVHVGRVLFRMEQYQNGIEMLSFVIKWIETKRSMETDSEETTSEMDEGKSESDDFLGNVDLNGMHRQCLILRSQCYAATKNYTRARADLEASHHFDGNDHRIFILQGCIAFREKKWEQCVHFFRQALSSGSGFQDEDGGFVECKEDQGTRENETFIACSALGSALIQTSEFSEGIEMLQRVDRGLDFEENGSWGIFCLERMAFALERLGRNEEAHEVRQRCRVDVSVVRTGEETMSSLRSSSSFSDGERNMDMDLEGKVPTTTLRIDESVRDDRKKTSRKME